MQSSRGPSGYEPSRASSLRAAAYSISAGAPCSTTSRPVTAGRRGIAGKRHDAQLEERFRPPAGRIGLRQHTLLRRLPGMEREQRRGPRRAAGICDRIGRRAGQPAGRQAIEQPVGIGRLLGQGQAETVEGGLIVSLSHRHAGARRRLRLRQQVELAPPVVVGFGQFAQRHPGNAAAVQRLAVRRKSREHRIEGLDRLLVAAQRRQGLALQRKQLRQVRLDPQGAFVAVERLLGPAADKKRVAVGKLRQDLVPDVAADQLIGLDLEREVAAPAEKVTPVRRACGHLRPQPARPVILAARGIASSLPVQQLGARQYRIGKARCPGERLVELGEGAIDVAAAHPQHAIAIVLLRAPGLQVDHGGRGPPPKSRQRADGRLQDVDVAQFRWVLAALVPDCALLTHWEKRSLSPIAA